jgi:Beta-glucan synthesis-associated protein SKN1/KRE6/Sbg1
MMFPAEMLVDYVRVYQRKGSSNVGCSPKAYPTADYINNHLDAYHSKSVLGWYPLFSTTDIFLDPNGTWTWTKPLNRLVCSILSMQPPSLISSCSMMAVDSSHHRPYFLHRLFRKFRKNGPRPQPVRYSFPIHRFPATTIITNVYSHTLIIASLRLAPSTPFL